MKHRTLFGLALFIPYLLWVVCALILVLLSLLEMSSEWGKILVMPFFIYAYGIFLWFIPYTLLALGMWFWSKGKTTKTLYRLALTAPILLSIFMIGEVVWASLPVDNVTELTQEIPNQIIFLGGLSLFFGYLCVGIAMGILKTLKAKNIIVEEISEVN